MTPSHPDAILPVPEEEGARAGVSDTVGASSRTTEIVVSPRRGDSTAEFEAWPSDLDDDAPPQAGDQLGAYRIDARLGAGVSCFVYRGWDDNRSAPVAVKVLNWANVYDRPAALSQMRTEAAALSRVKHPRVVRFIDFGVDPRWPYLVTEFVDGQPLGNLLRDGGALPADWALFLASQVLDGMGAVWRAGLVHRDIKPDNVLVGGDGGAKIIDFGLATTPVLRAEERAPELAGTASYLAPEQAKDARVVDLRADIYSLGVTLYEMLTGHLPFAGKNRMQMIYHHLHTPPVPPAQRAEGVGELASDLCLWMLAKKAEERPQNYEELRATFDAVLG